MEYYMDDEKWKVSSSSSSGNYQMSKSSLPRSVSQRAPNSSSSSSSNSKKNPFSLSRSSSQKVKSSSSSLTRNSSQKCSEFSRKCKEQKAKFYIVKRCITMLVSWKKHDDDS